MKLHQLITYLSLCVFMLSGCSTTDFNLYAKQSTNPTSLLDDSLFPDAQSIVIETPEEIFALSEDMKQIVRESFMPERNNQKKAMKLIKHIFNASNVGLAYKSHANLTASQTYHEKNANCMSLTIMAYALAKEAGLEADFQDVEIPEYWVRNGQYNMLTGHVNLLIQGVRTPNISVIWGATNLEIDFDPFIKKKNFPKTKIDLPTVIAMFYNNKGAQALVEKDYDTAYRYFAAAIDVEPKYAAGWGNMGILYRITNHLLLAENVYRHALSLKDNSLNTLTNLSILLEKQGRYDEARRIDSAILKQRIKNPYYHALLADEAFYAGDPLAAIKHYQRAIELNGKIHEFYFGLAKIYNSLGRKDAAKLAMEKAIRLNKFPDVEKQYLAKLSLLNQ